MSITSNIAGGRRRGYGKSPFAILLGFVPFVVFALLALLSVDLALWVAFATAFAVGIRDFAQARLLRFLDIVSIILFGAFALYTGFVQPGLPVPIVRLGVEGSFFLVCFLSILVRRPVTLRYASEPDEAPKTRRFIRTHYSITLVWSIAFAVMAAADAFADKNKELPASLDIAADLVALAVVIVFTARFPAAYRHVREGRNRNPSPVL